MKTIAISKNEEDEEIYKRLVDEAWDPINQHLSPIEKVCPVIINLMKNLGDSNEGVKEFKKYIVSDLDNLNEEKMDEFEAQIALTCDYYKKRRLNGFEQYADSVCYIYPDACEEDPFDTRRFEKWEGEK